MLKIFLTLQQKIKKLSKVKLIFLAYILIILFSSLLLYLPITHQRGQREISYINSLFLSASAFSDTGLSVINLEENWNKFGQAIVTILIMIGGFGFFGIKIYIFNFLLNRKFSTFSNNLAMTEKGGLSVGTTKKIVIVSLTILFFTVIVSSIILTLIFYFSQSSLIEADNNPQYNFKKSLEFGIFHALSAINNAGFDIVGKNSIQEYYNNYWLQTVFIFLFFIGGVGYPVIYDVHQKIRNRILKKEKYKLTLFSKISLMTYLGISVVGFLTVFMLEYFGNNGLISNQNYPQYGSEASRVFAILFNTLSTRSAGFATIDMNHLLPSSRIILAILMFIGAAPFSTAGGLRTTTFAIMLMAIISKFRGRSAIEMFKKRIDQSTIQQAISVFAFAIFLITTSALVLQIILENTLEKGEFNSVDIWFEICSAFGTAGLSTGLTNKVNDWAKFLLIFLMFIGQFGLSSTLFVLKKQKPRVAGFAEYAVPIA